MGIKEVQKVLAEIKSKLKESDLNVNLVDFSDNDYVKVKLSGGRTGSSGKSCSMGRRNSPTKGSGSLSREGAKLMIRDRLKDEVSNVKNIEFV